MKRREFIRHLERFGCVLADEGAKHSKYVILPIRAALQLFQDIRRSPVFEHARFAANSISQIQNRRATLKFAVSVLLPAASHLVPGFPFRRFENSRNVASFPSENPPLNS